MTAQEYIKNKIDKLSIDFSDLQCRYGFDEFSDTHLIEVIPIDLFLSKSFKDIQKEIIFDFIEKFPNQTISFISEDSLVELDNILYSKTGYNVK